MERKTPTRTDYQVETISKMAADVERLTGVRMIKGMSEDDHILTLIIDQKRPELERAYAKMATLPSSSFIVSIRFIAEDMGWCQEDYTSPDKPYLTQEESPLAYVASRIEDLFTPVKEQEIGSQPVQVEDAQPSLSNFFTSGSRSSSGDSGSNGISGNSMALMTGDMNYLGMGD